MATINSLPYLALKNIFSQLPLNDLIFLHEVCPLWAWYQTEILGRTTDLTLLLGTNPKERIARQAFVHLREKMFDQRRRSAALNDSRSHLRFDYLTNDAAHFLADRLPAISNLTVAINHVDCSVLDQLLPLICFWSSSLRSLKLYIKFADNSLYFRSYNQIPRRYIDILCATNRLTSLEHLTFDVDPSFMGHLDLTIPNVELPILGQLREFFYSSEDTFLCTIITNSLKKYATVNNRLEELEIVNGHFNWKLPQFARECPQLADKFRKVIRSGWISSVNLTNEPRAYVQQTFSLLPNLTQLTLNWFNLDFNEVLQTLTPLRQLDTLSVHFVNSTQHLPLSRLDALQPTSLPSLSSVKTLIIWAYGSTATDFNCRHWSHIFPNLESLQFYHSGPTECACCRRRKSKKEVLTEMEATLLTFTQCTKLQSIYTFELSQNLKQNWVVVQVKDKKVFLKV